MNIFENIIDKIKICAHGEHENIDVICNYRFPQEEEDKKSWKAIVCKKCFTSLRAQKMGKEYLEEHYDVFEKLNEKEGLI